MPEHYWRAALQLGAIRAGAEGKHRNHRQCVQPATARRAPPQRGGAGQPAYCGASLRGVGHELSRRRARAAGSSTGLLVGPLGRPAPACEASVN